MQSYIWAKPHNHIDNQRDTMALAAILERIRGNRREVELSAGEAYYILVRDVASGEEVDADQAAFTIADAGKSDSDFERDVEAMQKRLQYADAMRQNREAQAEAKKAEKEVEKAAAALDEAVNRLRPVLAAANHKLQAAELRVMQTSSAEERLVASCMNPRILDREAELIAKRKDLHEKRQPIEEDHKKASDYVRYYTGIVESYESRPVSEYRNQREKDEADAKQAAKNLANAKEAVRELNVTLAPFEKELAAIEKELSQLRFEKLTP